MTNLNVPSPHNRAKQVLCIAKLHMKSANGFLTRAGAEHFAQMREGVHQTPQAGRSILDARLRPRTNETFSCAEDTDVGPRPISTRLKLCP